MSSRARLKRRTWHGDELKTRARRANGRAILGMGEVASTEMAGAAHAISGDLKRSIHVAQVDSMGEVEPNVGSDKVATIEVGSWLPYACVENNRGGAHRFADIGWELAAPGFDAQLKRAWREEGM